MATTRPSLYSLERPLQRVGQGSGGRGTLKLQKTPTSREPPVRLEVLGDARSNGLQASSVQSFQRNRLRCWAGEIFRVASFQTFKSRKRGQDEEEDPLNKSWTHVISDHVVELSCHKGDLKYAGLTGRVRLTILSESEAVFDERGEPLSRLHVKPNEPFARAGVPEAMQRTGRNINRLPGLCGCLHSVERVGHFPLNYFEPFVNGRMVVALDHPAAWAKIQIDDNTLPTRFMGSQYHHTPFSACRVAIDLTCT